MGDLCVNIMAVNPVFLPVVKVLDQNGDDKVCQSEIPGISEVDFAAFVNTVRITLEVKAPLPIEIPEMIDISDNLSIMKEEIKVGLFKQVMQGYEITGHNTDKPRAILADPAQAGNPLTYLSFDDAIEFAKRLSEQTGRKFRLQTEEEWLQAKHKLTGSNWEWTETIHSGLVYILCSLANTSPVYIYHPEDHYLPATIRLVEDK